MVTVDDRWEDFGLPKRCMDEVGEGDGEIHFAGAQSKKGNKRNLERHQVPLFLSRSRSLSFSL